MRWRNRSLVGLQFSLVCGFVTVASVAVAQGSPSDAKGTVATVAFTSPEVDSRNKTDDSSPVNHDVTYRAESNPDGARVLHYRLEPNPTPDAATAQPSTPTSGAAQAASDGLLTSNSLSPRIRAGQSWVRAVSGYDTAAQSVRARTAAESSVTSFFAVRVEFEHGPAWGTADRVSLGGRLQLLDQKRHGIDGGFVAYYQPRDFRSEGNIVGGLTLGRSFSRLGLFGSVLIGSDPEGDDQDADGRLSMLYRVSDILHLGLDNRFQYVMSTDAKRFGTTLTDWDLAVEPTAVISLGPLALLAEGGFSALQTTGPIGWTTERRILHTGAIAMAGAGGVF